ncbi:MAG: hypothetical protein HQ592_00035 [Planctomycetes bacterium]|nr:hypothetical protein [Planctomycetota bacterium]
MVALIAIAVVAAFPAVALGQSKSIVLPDENADRNEAAASDRRITQERDEYLARMAMAEGAKYIEEGRYAEAKAQMEWVLSVQPQNKRAQDILARAQAELAKLAAAPPADKTADDTLKRNRIEMERCFYEANSLIANGNYEAAIQKLEMAVVIGDNIKGAHKLCADAAALLEKARGCRNALTSEEANAARKEAGEVVRAYDIKRSQRQRQRAKLLFDRAKSYYKLKEFNLALDCIDGVIEIEEQYPGAQFLKSKIETDGKKAIAADLRIEKKRSHDRELGLIDDLKIPQNELVVYPSEPRRHNIPRTNIPHTEETGPAVDAIGASLRKRVSCEFNGASLEETINYLRDLTGCNIQVDPRCAGKNDPIIDLSVNGKEMVHVLNIICRMGRAQWALKDEMIIVSDGDLAEKKYTELYLIEDLCTNPRNFVPGSYLVEAVGVNPAAGIGDGSRFSADEENEKEREEQGERTAQLIRDTIAPGTWSTEADDKGQNTIQFRAGKLVVTHNAEVHKQIVELLDAFRRARAIQVSVLARFIELSKNYIKRVGIDWTGLENLAVRGVSQAAGGIPVPAGAGFLGSGRLDEFGNPIAQAPWYLPDTPAALGPGQFGPTRGTPVEPAGDPTLGRRRWPALDPGGSRPGGPWDLRASNVNRNTVRFPGQFSGFNEFGGLFLDVAFLSRYQVRALIEAVEKDANSNVLTSPRLTCFNGQRANIVVATLVNYLQTYDDAGTPTIATVTDGVVLEVKPHVSADQRYVTMELLPSITELRGFETILIERAFTSENWAVSGFIPIELPEVFTRSVETTVSVPDGGTILIGGLSASTEEEGYATVPLLSRIPVIKYLFMNWGRIDTRSSLVILVTANILIQRELEPAIAASD